MKILAFSNWCEQEVLACKEGVKTLCPYCDGFGESDCDCCGSCTQCPECDGEGGILINDPLMLSRSKAAKEKYQLQVREDLKKFAKYIGSDFIFYDGQLLSAK